MRGLVGVTSCLVFLWLVSQGCYGNQVHPDSGPPPSPSQKILRRESQSRSYLVDLVDPPGSVPQETTRSDQEPKETLSPRKSNQVERQTSSSPQKPSPGPKESGTRSVRDTKLSSGPISTRLASLSGPKPRPKDRKTSKTDSVRVQRNDTKPPETDQDSQRPKLGWIWNQFYVLEEHVGPEPQYVGKLHSNSDRGDGSVHYILSGEGAGSIFTIDESTGDIHATESVDRETKSQYVLHATAIDRKTNRSLEAESEFIIKVQDVNDNAPTFPQRLSSASVPEMSDVGTSVFQVTAFDEDDPTYGNSAKIVYSILEGRPYFSIDPKSGIIRTAVSNLDRETQDHYAVVVQAKDMVGSVGGLSGSTTVNVSLIDVNDSPPRFRQKSYQLYVAEVAPVGVSVGRIRASDEDLGPNAEMIYGITNAEANAVFSISADRNYKDGVVSLKKPLDYEKRKVHTVNVEVSNRHPDPRFSQRGPFRDSTTLKVIVGDVDEPPVFSRDRYTMEVYENSPVGTQVGSITATDPDSTQSPIRFFMENVEDGASYFTVGVDSGLVRTTRVLDREETAWHNVTVKAAEVDNPGMVSLVSVTIQVLDVNDNVPTVSVSGGNGDVIVCDTTRRGQVVQTLVALDLDSLANGHFSFSVPSGLPVNPNFTLKDNGDSTASIVWTGTRTLDLDSVSPLVVLVSDGGDPPLSSSSTLNIRVCECRTNTDGRHGNAVCQDHHFLSGSGLGTGALVAVLFCIVVLVAVATLFVLLRNRKSTRDRLVVSSEDVRENVVVYDDEGGGEQDTEAFDIAALRNPKTKSQTFLDLDYGPYGDHQEVWDGQEVDYGSLEDPWILLEGDLRDFGRSGPSPLVLEGFPGDFGPSPLVQQDLEGFPKDFGRTGPSPLVLEGFLRDSGRSGPSPLVQQDLEGFPRDFGRTGPSPLVLEGFPRDFGPSLLVQQVLDLKVVQADLDTRGPPYDSLQTYAYEGLGSSTGSVSSLGLTEPTPELNYALLEDLGPTVGP